MTKSWRTSVCGILAIVAVVASVVKAELDGDPTTIPDWGLASSAVLAGLVGIFSRDNKVTSEQVGAK
jgi:hypothetical protein